jgi:hypothetical protein
MVADGTEGKRQAAGVREGAKRPGQGSRKGSAV